jgi:hypothetical protein
MGMTRQKKERFDYVNIGKIVEFVKKGRLDPSQVLIYILENYN